MECLSTHDQIPNPFIRNVPFNKIKVNDFDRVFVLASHVEIDLNEIISLNNNNELQELCRNFYIYECSTKILNNSYHTYNILILDKEILKYISTEFDLYDKELVVTLWGLTKEYIEIYLKQYENCNNFDNYLKMKDINNYFNDNNSFATHQRIKFIGDVKESNYWSNSKMCYSNNSTSDFLQRNFRLEVDKITNEKLKNDIVKIEDDEKNYLSCLDINNDKIDNLFVSLIGKNNYFYNIPENIKYDNTYISKLVKSIDNEKELYYLIATLLLSKNYCHLVINNFEVMDYLVNTPPEIKIKFKLNTSFLNKYISLFKFCIGYIWILFYKEESIKKSYITEDDRFVFDIKTAYLLPNFPFNSLDPFTNPYFPITVNSEVLDIQKNILSCGYIRYRNNNKHILYGPCDLNTFKLRLEIFCNNNFSMSNSIFNNIDWTNIAFTGSVIAACLPKFNPMFLLFKKTFKRDIPIFINFIDKYFNGADLDVMCNIQDTFEYIREVNKFYNTIRENIIKYYHIETTMIYEKKVFIYVTKDYLSKLDCEDKFNIKNDIVKEILYNNYLSFHFNRVSKFIDDEIFKDKIFNKYFEPVSKCNINFSIKNKYEDTQDFSYYENNKFKILKNNILKRDIDIFKTKYESFTSKCL